MTDFMIILLLYNAWLLGYVKEAKKKKNYPQATMQELLKQTIKNHSLKKKNNKEPCL